MKTHFRHRQSGLNLVEILVAALILSVGLLSLAGLQVASLKSIQGATHKQQASFMIHELFERMRSNREAALNGAYNTPDDGIACGTTPEKDCGASAACTPAELATYDLFTVQCGENVAGSVNSGSGTQLINGKFEVDCVTAGDCSAGVVVEFSWSELLSDRNIEDEGNDGLETQTMLINATI